MKLCRIIIHRRRWSYQDSLRCNNHQRHPDVETFTAFYAARRALFMNAFVLHFGVKSAVNQAAPYGKHSNVKASRIHYRPSVPSKRGLN